PEFRSLSASGASHIDAENKITSSTDMSLHATGSSGINVQISGVPKLTAEASGASNIVLAGQAHDLNASLSGACHLRSFDLVTENAFVDLSGASKAEVNANRQLNVEASGASDVRYKGSAAVNSKTSGASDVTKVG
ncbi:MAG: DUF2807 domain-containing protein, partial [Chitinophagaceae bacterium]|nr:DUF2807 domain-containing protein [Chitinophagaceae bacterium]